MGLSVLTTALAVGVSDNPLRAQTVTSQPSSVSACANGNTSFSVVATNATGYQWQVNTGTGFTSIADGGVYSGATTASLTLTGVTASMNSYTYRVTVSGSTPVTSNAVTLTVTTTNTWTGASSSSWINTANWSCGSLPTATLDAVFPAGTMFSAQVNTTTAICRNITINSGAALSFAAGSNVLEVKGNFTNNGSFVASSGKLKLSGSGAQAVPAATYKDFELAGSGIKTASGAINISGILTLTNGFLQMGASDLTLGNSASISGASLLNPSPTSYIITNSTGQMRIQNIGATGKTGAVLFPVGTSSSSYTPVTLQNTGTVDAFGVRLINNVYQSYTSTGVPNGPVQNTYNVGKTWLINENTAGGSNVTLEFGWSSFDEQPGFNDGACSPSQWYNGGWHSGITPATANGFDPYSRSMANITSLSYSPFAVGSQFSIALPLELLSFTGKAGSAGTALRWVTASEQTLTGFDVERSLDGRTFTRIGTVPARGDGSTAETVYDYTDAAAPAGTPLYYRLKMADQSGTAPYSNTVMLRNDAIAPLHLSVFPNPVMDAPLVIRLGRPAASDLPIRLSDALGRIWYNTTVEKGQEILTVPTDALPTGLYLLRVNGPGQEATTRIIKY